MEKEGAPGVFVLSMALPCSCEFMVEGRHASSQGTAWEGRPPSPGLEVQAPKWDPERGGTSVLHETLIF